MADTATDHRLDDLWTMREASEAFGVILLIPQSLGCHTLRYYFDTAARALAHAETMGAPCFSIEPDCLPADVVPR